MTKTPPALEPARKLTPFFCVAFAATLFVSLLLFFVHLYLVHHQELGDEAKRLSDNCATLYTFGFGSVLGLLGGKTMP
ncbi:MAG TPA: hypothetical protein VKA46_39015 [Gemmataceae bacterium]|nr:hypothetical protein [Gemmataceae bacterium]